VQKYIKFHKKSKKIEWSPAPDVKRRVLKLLNSLSLGWSKKPRIFCFRSLNANTRAYARIWGLSRIWQQALNLSPSYIIEVISEKFDELSDFEQDKVLLHEIAHIPKNFSGALVPHIRRGKRNFRDKVEKHLLDYLRGKK
jgi:predicted metallopeptidase